ncbi:GNAT family N-acetyltransferase [Paraliobacillus salinarum]|uniref:GNAT family N-acetyltransferase n=1 Tax=Paraliobacillus salinarum TaxID=1158996 RepID=UPI0015F42208|nr:GNAT family N-acetyltransferase [Paraliobacillus salinarum]
MIIRKYKPEDCKYIAELFYDTVHTVNAKDYDQEQLNVWATGSVDLNEWNNSFMEHVTLVAVEDDRIVGFGDIEKTGYLNRLYVHKDYQNQGIATILCNGLEKSVDADAITTCASITAKQFFIRRGFKIIKEQEVIRRGVLLTNYLMKKSIE